MASGCSHSSHRGYLDSGGGVKAFRSERSGCCGYCAGLPVLEARRQPSTCPGGKTHLPGLPTGKGIRLPCHVSLDRTSRLACDQRRQAMEHPRTEGFRGTHSQFVAVGPESKNPRSHYAQSKVKRGKRLPITLSRLLPTGEPRPFPERVHIEKRH